jgi:hypothetical protein
MEVSASTSSSRICSEIGLDNFVVFTCGN